jgi:hypothetical protein
MHFLSIKKQDIAILLPIVLVGLFLRVHKLSSMVGFDFDQEYAAMFADTILKVFPVQMIGQGLSVPGLFMGPFYFYYLVPFFALTHLHPIGGYIGSIALGLSGIVLSYVLLKHVFGQATAILGSFLLSVLLLYIQYDWAMAPTYSSIGIVILTWFCLYAYWHKHMQFLPVLAFIFGMFTSFHPILFPFYLVFFVLVLIKRKFPSIKIFLFSVLCFLLPLTPLLMFEYFRHFLEVKALFSLSQTSKGEPKTFTTLIEYALILFRFPVLLTSVPIQGLLATAFSAIVYGVPLAMASKKIGFWKDRFHITILITTLVVFLLYYVVLPTHVPEYYFLGVEVILFIYIVATMGLLLKTQAKIIVLAFVGFLTIYNIGLLTSRWSNSSGFALSEKEFILQKIKTIQGDKPNFDIRYNIDPGQEYGFGYLRRLYNLRTEEGESHTIYEIVMPLSRTTEKIDIFSPSKSIGVIIRK